MSGFPKFEYKQEVHQGDRITLVPWLNRQGKDGWEMVTFATSTSNGFWYFTCTFKRQLMKFARPDRANNEQLYSMLIGLCNQLEAKTIDRTIDTVPNLRKWWTANRPGKKPRTKHAIEHTKAPAAVAMELRDEILSKFSVNGK